MNTAERVYYDVLELPEPLAQEVLQFVESLKRKCLPLNTKAKFIQEALDSRDSYQKTGLHLTGEEVQDWLATWGTENEKELKALALLEKAPDIEPLAEDSLS